MRRARSSERGVCLVVSIHLPIAVAASFAIAGCSTDPSFVDSASAASASSTSGSGGGGGAGDCGDIETDPDDCGSCGHSCLGGDCMSGKCQPVEILGAVPDFAGRYAGIAVDAGHVFVGDRGSARGTIDGGIFRIDKRTTTADLLVANGLTTAWEIAVDDDQVYWSCFEDDSMRRVAKSGGPLQFIAASQTPPWPDRPWGVAVDATSVYWAAAAGVWRRAAVGSINMASDHFVGSTAAGVAVDGDGVTFLTDDDGTVFRFDGTNAIKLATGQAAPNAIAVDDASVYWLDTGDGRVMRVDKTGRTAPEQLALGEANPTGLALDETHVYWTTWGSCTEATCAHGTVSRVPKRGGEVTVLAEGDYLATDVAVEDEAVYWTTWSASSVLRLAK